MAAHNEKALARIEELLGQEKEPQAIVITRHRPWEPNTLIGWYLGSPGAVVSPEAKAAETARWKKAEAVRLKKERAAAGGQATTEGGAPDWRQQHLEAEVVRCRAELVAAYRAKGQEPPPELLA